jgi:hypothetical protein
MAIISGYKPFFGQHCETTATGNLLKHAGMKISEPMMFGIGEGLSFGVFNWKNMPAPFIGGRTRQDEVTKTLAKNLGFEVEYRHTRSKKRAWENVASFVDAGQPVAVKLDMYFLDYFEMDMHFAAHYVAVYGYDDEKVYVVDTDQMKGEKTTSRESFEEARLWKGPMSSDALTWTVKPNGEIEWPEVIRKAIVSNATTYLNPPIRNLGIKGIRKAAEIVPTWLETVENAPEALAQIAMLMEEGGTGGALFRNFYRDFLTEADGYLNSPSIREARDLFAKAVPFWNEAAKNIERAGTEGVVRLQEAVGLLIRIAEIEEEAARKLAAL